jgi:hypothetical protein
MLVTTVGNENLAAAQAFHRSARKSTTRFNPPDQPLLISPELTAERKPTTKKEEQICVKRSKKRPQEENRIFKPALLPHFQTGVQN